MKVHIIEKGVVANTIEVSSLAYAKTLFPESVCVDGSTGTISDKYENGVVVPNTGKIFVPQTVTRRQALQALLLTGNTSKVEQALAAIPDATQRGMAQIEFAESLQFDRNRPLLVSLCTAIGMSSPQIDDLFIQASKL